MSITLLLADQSIAQALVASVEPVRVVISTTSLLPLGFDWGL
jgi:hypothetical protein